VIFGYVFWDIREHLLEKVWSILVARSLGTRLGTGTQWLDRTGKQREMNFLWTLCNENEEEKAWDLLWHGRGVSRPPFIGQGRERRGHGRAGTASNEEAAK
jgi:hypothetical protein